MKKRQYRFPVRRDTNENRVLGFTLVVSDSDQPGKRSQGTMMATSQLKWGNPFTFGECYLLKEKYELPAYPPEEIWWNR